MELWNWYNHLMGNNIVLFLLVLASIILINLWGKLEEKWKRTNTYSSGKKVIKIIGIILIAVFGLPGIIIFFGSI